MQPTQFSLDLDYTSLYVWNSSSISVDLSIDGAYYTTLSAGSSLQLSPLHADSVVTASCKTDAGEVLTDSVPASNRSFEVLFSLGKSMSTMTTTRNGRPTQRRGLLRDPG
ncbi:MAG: hypothetical protein ACLR8U_01850 [Oscillospiraceae bacterium]